MFADLTGNQQAAESLRRLLANTRVPNSAIFAGPDGVGKKQFALELARAFVCGDASHPESCGACHACLRVGDFNIPKPGARGEDYDTVFFSGHPDVGLVIPFNRNLRVGSIRRLEHEANFRPYEARARFFIVDNADRMNDAASNALLKTLEEPAATSHIILITSRPDALLRTIRSRSQMVRFGALSATEIELHLVQKAGRSAEDASLAARTCGGSIARALSMDIGAFRAAREAMLEVVAALGDARVASLLQSSEWLNAAVNKDELENNLSILESLLRDAWLLKLGAPEASLANCDIAVELKAASGSRDATAFTHLLTDIESVRKNFAVNINRKIAIDALLVGAV